MPSFFFFIRWRKKMERMKVEERVVRLSPSGGFGWCATLVIVKDLLWHISHRDRMPPSRVIGRSPAPIESGSYRRRLWIASVIPRSSSHVLQASVCSNTDTSCLEIPSVRWAIERDNGVFLSGSTNEALSLPESDLLFGAQGVVWYHYCLVCLIEVRLESGALSWL